MDDDRSSQWLQFIAEGTTPYEIPPELVKRWQETPPEQRFTPALQRVAWDKLYRAIDLLNLNALHSANVAMCAATARDGEYQELQSALATLAANSVLVQNSLRQFQEIIMQTAVDELDTGA